MRMQLEISKRVIFTFIIALCLSMVAFATEMSSTVVVFSDSGFPCADSGCPSAGQLQKLFAGARLATADQLQTHLDSSATHLLVLPYGSAFPEREWSAIFQFLEHGGNLLVLGGMPFTRAAYRDSSGWHLRDYSVRYMRPLMIDQYQSTPGSDGLEFQTNRDLDLQLPPFTWKHAFSPVIRLSAVDLYSRGGSAGAIDARLDAMAWGTKNSRKLSAPVIEIDHLRNAFDGGRWIFLNAELDPEFYSNPSAEGMIHSLTDRAAEGAEEFTVRPVLPLYMPGEPVQVEVAWQSRHASKSALTLRITTYPESDPANRTVTTTTVPSPGSIGLSVPKAKGLQIIEAQLMEGSRRLAIYRSGFWVRDEAYLRSGPRLTVNRDYFEVNGRPMAVMGTTYMSSEVQRLYFEHPNVYIWNRDLAQISAAGLNMIRTGWWTGWDKFCDEDGHPYERTLRTLEAYLMTARKNGLPVQFNFFAFLPDVLGGVNSYLDPQAVRKQRTLISTVAARFHDVPFLAWDLINEPSISRHLWTMRPGGDPVEAAKWNQWLNRRYPDRASLAAAWNLPVNSLQGAILLPEEGEFDARNLYVGKNSLKMYDYFLFAQDSFADWARTMREAIRAAGSQQLVTVGQDEGGVADRLSPAFFGSVVDFTTNHSWWQNDHLLWDSLVSKQPGKPMLIQETGLQRELNLDEVARRTAENEAALLERKVALSFAQGSGAIQWLWHTNSYMTESNETPIGAVRPDGTEKPEAAVMRDYAAFAQAVGPHLRHPEPPNIAVVTSQAAQFSVMSDMQLEAQRKAIRALVYGTHLTPYVIAEAQIENIGSPKLVVLPSPQALTETAWRRLLAYVNEGGNLLVTGPLERDEHWHTVTRAAEFSIGARSEPLTYRRAALQLDHHTIWLSFDQQKQSCLEALRFADGTTLKDISLGNGRIFWATFPVELSEGTEAATDLYAYVAGRLNIAPLFEPLSALSPGVMLYPVVLEDSVLYVAVSESSDTSEIDIRDKLTEVRLTFALAGEHAALALIGKQEKRAIAKYGF
jgi:hypothetical protein